jgi:cell division inhibitor SepF
MPRDKTLGRLARAARPGPPLLRITASPWWTRVLLAAGAQRGSAGDSMAVSFPAAEVEPPKPAQGISPTTGRPIAGPGPSADLGVLAEPERERSQEETRVTMEAIKRGWERSRLVFDPSGGEVEPPMPTPGIYPRTGRPIARPEAPIPVPGQYETKLDRASRVVLDIGGETIVTQLRTFNDAWSIADHFRAGLAVLMLLTGMKDQEALRVVDFAAGLVAGLGGTMKPIDDDLLLLIPAERTSGSGTRGAAQDYPTGEGYETGDPISAEDQLLEGGESQSRKPR